ncbi:MAG: glutaredoxin domain-containing protein [Candidatus Nanopelagicales bacterium]
MIEFYGADWCGDCRRSKRQLDELGVEYTYIDTEKTEGAIGKVLEYNQGAQSIPVIVFPDGTHLTEPSNPALKAKLEQLSLI